MKTKNMNKIYHTDSFDQIRIWIRLIWRHASKNVIIRRICEPFFAQVMGYRKVRNDTVESYDGVK